MMNTKLWYILELLKQDVVSANRYEIIPKDIKGIEMENGQSTFHSGTVYILPTPERMATLREKIIFPGVIVLICGTEEGTDPWQKEPRDYIGICLRERFEVVFNRINNALLKYQEYKDVMFNIRLDTYALDQFLNVVSEKLRCYTCFITRQNEIVYSRVGDTWAEPVRESLRTGAEPIMSWNAILPDESKATTQVDCLDVDGKRYYCGDVRQGDYRLGMVILREQENAHVVDPASIAMMMIRAVLLRIDESMMTARTKRQTLTSLLTTVMDSPNAVLDTWRDLFDYLPIPVKQFICPVVIRMETHKVENQRLYQLCAEIQRIYPQMNVCSYQDQVILLLSYDTKDEFRLGQVGELQKILEKYDAIAGSGDPFSRREHIKTAFRIARQMVRMGPALRFRETERWFTRNSYMYYLIIDMAFRAYLDIMGHSNIGYLLDPRAIRLLRYDAEHGTELVHLLHLYLYLDRNAGETAVYAYMHQNTVRNRIRKIETIMECDLSDTSINFQLLFSCCVLRYCDKYKKIDLRYSSGAMIEADEARCE